MVRWYEEPEPFDEIPDEYSQQKAHKIAESKAMQIPDVDWQADIEKIENPDIKKKEIEIAEKFNQKWQGLDEKLESGQITEADYFGELIGKRWPEQRKHTTRCGLESEGITYDDLGDVAEDWDFLLADAGGNPRPAKLKNELRQIIDRRGPQACQKLADDMLKDEKISQQTHDSILRQVRLYEK
jgi:hypothetical protein